MDTVVFDVDGTLVDSNYHHALSWHRSFRRFDITVPVWKLHRAIGMGGDQLVAAVADDDVEAALGDALRQAWGEEFAPMLKEIQPFEGATELLASVKRHGARLVLASSGSPEHVEHYLDLIDGRRHADAWTTAEDVDATKPAPDLVQVAMDKVQAQSALMVGDSPWDAIAAGKIGVETVAVRTGGFSEQELRDAGAAAVFDTLADLQRAVLERLGRP